MATVTYSFIPGQAVWVVKPASFGIGRATIQSVQITADPVSKKYSVLYVAPGRVAALVDEAEIYVDLATALVAYGPLVV
jgi:hypothetical protein